MVKKDFVEIRIHGRGGQGAWTASRILAEAALQLNKYAQSFPEFGPERSGAPVTAYARIGGSPIDIHCSVTKADYVIVIDPTLVDLAVHGLKKNAKIIVTHSDPPEELRKKLKVPDDVEVYSLNAVKLALDIIGRPLANTAMLGAFVRATEDKIITLDSLIEALRKVLGHRLSETLINKNIELIKRAYNEVKKG